MVEIELISKDTLDIAQGLIPVGPPDDGRMKRDQRAFFGELPDMDMMNIFHVRQLLFQDGLDPCRIVIAR